MSSEKKVSELTEVLTAHLVQENMERSNDFPFQKAKRRFNWHEPSNEPIQRIKYDYEEKLFTLLKKNSLNHDLHENRPIVIVGGRGSGKSTAVVNVLKRLKTEETVTYLRVDMNQWDDRPFEDEEEERLQRRFSSHLSEKIRAAAPIEPSLEQELFEFFPWCIENREHIGDIVAHIEPFSAFVRRRSTHLRKLVSGEAYGRRTPEQLHDHLVDGREEMLDEMSEIDFVWYQLLQLMCFSGWSPKKVDLSRRVLILDNIDPVDPRLQRFAAKLFQSITLASGIQTIIPMRPHTQVTGAKSSGADWYTREEHCSPDLIDVINARLDNLIAKTKSDDSVRLVKSLRRALNRDAKHLKEIVQDTSALDIRTGLINFANFSERFLASRGIHTEFDLDQSEVCRLFFLGDKNRFNYSYVENLFFYSSAEEQILTMSKIFVLDYLLRFENGATTHGKLCNFLRSMEFSQTEIECSLSNLLSRSRALVWSPDGFDVLNFAEETTLRATPLAFTYYFRLFGEYYYTEVCMMDRRFHKVSVSEVLAFERDFVKREIQALVYFARNEGSRELCKYYNAAEDFLGYRHWQKFQIGAKFRVKSDYGHLIDAQRADWLRGVYKKLLSGDDDELDKFLVEIQMY